MTTSIHYIENLDLLIAFCDYRERCSSEVKEKIRSLAIEDNLKVRLLEDLIERNIFDDTRFLEAFIGGKIRIKRWGRNKIKAALFAKKLSEDDIRNALEEYVDMELYREQLLHLFTRKWDQLKNSKDYGTRQKLFRFLYGKGYESDLINELFKEYLED